MRSLARCIVIAAVAFCLVIGTFLATRYVMNDPSTARYINAWHGHWLSLGIPFVLGGVLCGSGVFFCGAPRLELFVGATAGGSGLSWIWSQFDPSLWSFLGCLLLGTGVFWLAELFGFAVAARMQRRT